MKYFDNNDNEFWGEKKNWVDENNVLLGYDYGSS